jgi:hypothetical protein
MPALPNPFLTSVACDAATERPAAVSSLLVPTSEAAAGPTPATAALLDEINHLHDIYFASERRFVLDEEAFFAAIEPVPMFLQAAAE